MRKIYPSAAGPVEAVRNLTFDVRRGELACIVPYAGGLQDGEARFLLPGGRLVRSAAYAAGLLHGEARDYDAGGALLRSTMYAHGKKEGMLRRFLPDGTQTEAVLYHENQPVPAPAATAEPGAPVAPAAARRSWLARLVEG